MNFGDLVSAIADATRAAFADLKAARPDDRLYGFALFTGPCVEYVMATAFSEEGLDEVSARYAGPDGDPSEHRRSLRWSPADSPLHGIGDERFASIDAALEKMPDPSEDESEAGRRLEACFAALGTLDDEGLFDAGEAREALVVGVLQGDQSHRSILENAERLNPPATLARLRADLDIREPAGVVASLGEAYQISELVYTSGILLACGSGGDLLIHRREGDGWSPIEAPQRGSRWAGDVAPDGRSVVLGDHKIVQAAAIEGDRLGELRTLLESDDKISGLFHSPDGETILVGSWGGLFAIDGAGERRWKIEPDGKVLAWHPDGRRAAVPFMTDLLWIDPADGSTISTVTFPANPEAIAISPDGSVMAVSHGGGYGKNPPPVVVAIHDVEDGALRVACRGSNDDEDDDDDALPDIRGLAFSPDATRLAAASTNGEILVWSTATGRLEHRGHGRQESMTEVVWIDEKTVAAAGRDVDSGPAIVFFEFPCSVA